MEVEKGRTWRQKRDGKKTRELGSERESDLCNYNLMWTSRHCLYSNELMSFGQSAKTAPSWKLPSLASSLNVPPRRQCHVAEGSRSARMNGNVPVCEYRTSREVAERRLSRHRNLSLDNKPPVDVDATCKWKWSLLIIWLLKDVRWIHFHVAGLSHDSECHFFVILKAAFLLHLTYTWHFA